MPLIGVPDIAPGLGIKAADILQYFNLFTGVMQDQPVTFKYQALIGGGSTISPASTVLTVKGVATQSGDLILTQDNLGNPLFEVKADGSIAQHNAASIITGSGGLQVTGGGLTVTAGGLIVTAGGIAVSGGLTVSTGLLTVSAGGLTVTGDILSHGSTNDSSAFGLQVTNAAATQNNFLVRNDGQVFLGQGGTVRVGAGAGGGLTVAVGGLAITSGNSSTGSGNFTIGAGGMFITPPPFAAGSKYLILDGSNQVRVSALGPAS